MSFCACLCLLFCLFVVGWFFFHPVQLLLTTARRSLPLTRAGIFTGQSTFSDRRSFVRVAAVAQKKNMFVAFFIFKIFFSSPLPQESRSGDQGISFAP